MSRILGLTDLELTEAALSVIADMYDRALDELLTLMGDDCPTCEEAALFTLYEKGIVSKARICRMLDIEGGEYYDRQEAWRNRGKQPP